MKTTRTIILAAAILTATAAPAAANSDRLAGTNIVGRTGPIGATMDGTTATGTLTPPAVLYKSVTEFPAAVTEIPARIDNTVKAANRTIQMAIIAAAAVAAAIGIAAITVIIKL